MDRLPTHLTVRQIKKLAKKIKAPATVAEFALLTLAEQIRGSKSSWFRR